MHHKRRRAKNRRAGCLLCKPHKANGAKGRAAYAPVAVRRSDERVRDELAELGAAAPGALDPAADRDGQGGARTEVRPAP